MAPNRVLRRPSPRPARRGGPWARRASVVAVVVGALLAPLLTSAPDATAQAAATRTAPDAGAGATSWVPDSQLVPAAATTWTFGQEPLDDVLYWAAQKATCGLTTNQLAALMLAPTYPETGASGAAAPSPMTLSRYDTSAGLYAFGDKATAYPRAFWHPGVGAWAFDSAGGWNLSAAQAISTDTAAQQAATTMAARWCASSPTATDAARRASVWGIWYGCNSGACESFYQAVYDPSTLKIAVDPTVTRSGGMDARSCRVAGVGDVACFRVDPARAQGYSAWNIPAWGPSPVSAPFYDFTSGGTEYRVWLKGDSGYDTTITASKPVTSNARSGLVWSKGDVLCDTTTGAGSCDWSGWAPYSGAWAGRPAVVTNGDGRLEVFAVGFDGVVYHSWQATPNGAWSGWEQLRGITTARSVVAGRAANGRLVVVVTGSDGVVWQADQLIAGWAPWGALGPGPTRSLAMGTNADGRLEVFGLDDRGSVVHQWQTPWGGWSGWWALDSRVGASAISVASNADGRLELFEVDGGGTLAHAWQVGANGPFSPWLAMGGGLTGRVSAINNAGGRLELFGRGTDGGLWHAWQVSPNGNWSGLAPLGGQIGTDPEVVRNRDGRLEVFDAQVAGAVGHLWQVAAGARWSPWAAFDGGAAAALVGAANADGHLVLFRLGGDTVIARNVQLV